MMTASTAAVPVPGGGGGGGRRASVGSGGLKRSRRVNFEAVWRHEDEEESRRCGLFHLSDDDCRDFPFSSDGDDEEE